MGRDRLNPTNHEQTFNQGILPYNKYISGFLVMLLMAVYSALNENQHLHAWNKRLLCKSYPSFTNEP